METKTSPESLKRQNESDLPDPKRKSSNPPDQLWFIDALSRVHCMQTSVIMERAPQSYFARIARSPGTMSQDEPTYMSIAPWFLKGVTSWAQVYSTTNVSFPGHTPEEVKEVLDKISYTSEKDGDLPISSRYLPSPPPMPDKYGPLLCALDAIMTADNFCRFRDALKYNIDLDIAQDFFLTNGNAVHNAKLKIAAEAFAAAGGTDAVSLKFEKLLGHACRAEISFNEEDIIRSGSTKPEKAYRLCIKNKAV